MTGSHKPSDQENGLDERLDVDFARRAAGLGIWELDPEARLFSLDDRCRELFGLTHNSSLAYKQFIRHIYPDDVIQVDKAIQWALNAKSGGAYDHTFRTIGPDNEPRRWVRFIGQAYFNEAGEAYRFAGIVQEVTKEMQFRQPIDTSEQRFRKLIQEAPFAIGIYTTRDLIIEMANDAIIKIWGKTPAVIGTRLVDALPELEGQPFIELLEQVYDTGIAYRSDEQQANLVVDGRLQPYWFTFTYQPLTDAQGQVYAILNMAADVTERVLANQEIAQAEAVLRDAVELAELATWSIDPTTGLITYGKRMKEWIGVDDDDRGFDEGMNPVPEIDRERIRLALERVMHPDGKGIYDQEHLIENIRTGQRRIIHAQARVHFNPHNEPYKLIGTAQDVTQQRQIQLALEQQVQERTEELAAINEEFAATNEELAATNEELAATNEELISTNGELADTNEELAESNQLLTHSNQNLEQFAYIASHDLQEPLRKIQQFSDLLKIRYADSSGEELNYLNRMQVAASRMSLLIKDLLAFSRISTSQAPAVPVSLNQVVDQTLENLSVAISESKAQIEVGDLPTLLGDDLQLEQLFQNLLSNALKFSRIDPTGARMTPQITIRAHKLLAIDLPPPVRPSRQTAVYYCIEVVDNGIGFDEKYTDRIFQVFQRLHGRNEFAGTGVGLAICQKVVTNHGGAITATSKPGKGATFCVYLPA